jgi:hypothetical protein
MGQDEDLTHAPRHRWLLQVETFVVPRAARAGALWVRCTGVAKHLTVPHDELHAVAKKQRVLLVNSVG